MDCDSSTCPAAQTSPPTYVYASTCGSSSSSIFDSQGFGCQGQITCGQGTMKCTNWNDSCNVYNTTTSACINPCPDNKYFVDTNWTAGAVVCCLYSQTFDSRTQKCKDMYDPPNACIVKTPVNLS